MNLNSMKALYISQLQDMHSAEKQLVAALPKMAAAASAAELGEAFESHLAQTQGQLDRIERILENLGEKPGREKCEAMQGLITEGGEVIKAKGDARVRDAGLIVAAQKVEHYEIAAYGSLCVFAEHLDRAEDLELLKSSLGEEKETDERLTELAESGINVEAAEADGEDD